MDITQIVFILQGQQRLLFSTQTARNDVITNKISSLTKTGKNKSQML